MTSRSDITTQEGAARPVKRGPNRISAKVRAAVDQIVTQGKTQRAAAQHVGMNETSLGRALARPQVSLYLQEQKAMFAAEVNELHEMARKVAINVAIDLLHNGNETTKAKMVEFFAGERRNSPSIVINNTVNSKGYEYAKPGQRVVDVLDAEVVPDQVASLAKQGDIDTPSDMQSVGRNPQGIEDAE